MPHLSAEQLQTLRHKLIALERELSEGVEMASESAQPVDLDQPIGRLSRMDALQNQEMAKANLGAQAQRLSLVREAIEAMDDGEYGPCILCEMPIAYLRLQSLPETPTCLTCQERQEQA